MGQAMHKNKQKTKTLGKHSSVPQSRAIAWDLKPEHSILKGHKPLFYNS